MNRATETAASDIWELGSSIPEKTIVKHMREKTNKRHMIVDRMVLALIGDDSYIIVSKCV